MEKLEKDNIPKDFTAETKEEIAALESEFDEPINHIDELALN